MRAVLYAAVIGLSSILVFGPYDASGHVENLALGLIAGAALPLVDLGYENRRYAALALGGVWAGRNKVRVSAAYLYRIRVDGKFLLIRGGRFPTQFQPVGGVFKVAATGRGKLVELGAADDNLIPLDTASADDLRIRLEGCRLVSFLKWFESGQGRETSPWREFQEELVGSCARTLVSEHLPREVMGRAQVPLERAYPGVRVAARRDT